MIFNLFFKAKCFKISTSDNTDDVVDQYACLTAQVASIAVIEY